MQKTSDDETLTSVPPPTGLRPFLDFAALPFLTGGARRGCCALGGGSMFTSLSAPSIS